MTQNVSSKMLRSLMIRKRQSISYETSGTKTIMNIIIDADIAANKNLLFSLGYDVYKRHYDSVLRSSLSVSKKYDIQNTFSIIISGLNTSEEKTLGIYQETAEDISQSLYDYETSIVKNPDFIFYCTVYDNGKMKSLIIKNMQKKYKLSIGKKYIFNLEDESNYGTSLSFSKRQLLYEDVDGIYRVGTPGTPGACLVFIPGALSYYYSVQIYNKNDYTRLSFREYGYIYSEIYFEYSYNLPYTNDTVFITEDSENVNQSPFFGESVLHIVENKGPTYILSSDASYTETITDTSYVSYIWYERISEMKETFGMYYGYYKLSYRFTSNRIALINKGVNSYGISMENLIQVYSDSGRDVEVQYLEGLDESGDLDGYYNFYYTPLTIKVLGDFEKCSLYTSLLGYNKLEDILFFDDKYANYSINNPDGYQDISNGNTIRLYPETDIYFHEVDSDTLNLTSLYSDISINDRPRISLNYVDGNSYDSTINYGLYKGQYVIRNISENRPIAIINKDENNTKEDCIKYFGSEEYKKQRLGPDGKTVFDYYYHTVIIQVFGDFGKVSIYEYSDGFCGGETLLTYSESFSDISSEFQSWYETYDAGAFQEDCSSTEISIDVSGPSTNNFTDIYQVSSYINCDVSINSEGDNVILFDDISNSLTKYCFDTGNFVVMNVPSTHPIAFLNKDREDLFFYDGYYAYSTTNIATDGNTYTYYYGNINITVAGNFGQLTFETLTDSYMGGFRKLMYNNGSDNTTKGLAVHHWGVNTYYDMLTSDSSDGPQNYYLNVRVNIRPIDYSEDHVSYRFSGYDRNGVIDSETDNPDLTFAIGDVVYFTFEDNSEQPFGIYTYHNLLDEPQLITNNSNTTNSQISWIPNIIISNYYFYRSTNYFTNFAYNTITIINNENAEIVLDIVNIYTDPQTDISYNENLSPLFEASLVGTVLLTSFNIEFDEIININSSRNLYIYNISEDTIDITIPATQIVQNSEKSATYETGFTMYNVNSLEFDTSYALLMDEELFENIYYNTISGDIETYVDISAYNLLEFSTEPRHEAGLVSIVPDSNSTTLNEISGYILLEFDEPVIVPSSSDVPGDNNITFLDTSGNSTDYSSYESSGNYLYIYYSDLSYNTSYSVIFDDYSIVDLSNIDFTISDSSLSDYSIQTIEDPRPSIQYYIPNNDISNTYVDQPISLIFSENVYLDTSSNGRIQIEDVSNTSVFDYFDVSNNDDVSGIIFGSGTNTLRIYPFDADLSFSDNTTYSISIDSDVIKDISDNYYPGITTSDSNAITFTTGDTTGDAQDSLISENSGNIVTDDSGNAYILFNGDTSYDSKQYTLSVGSYIIDISESYPFTLLNSDLSDVIQVSISNDAIEITVAGGSTEENSTTNDYFDFTDSNGNAISLANGDLKFMQGQTYTFKDNNGINDNFEFVLYYNGTSVSLPPSSGPPRVSITIPDDMTSDDNSFYYCAKNTTSDSYGDDITTNYDASLTLLYTEVSEDSENGNGTYGFYYGNVVIDICSNNFGSFSFYTYNNGYMGGKYAFTFEDTYSG